MKHTLHRGGFPPISPEVAWKHKHIDLGDDLWAMPTARAADASHSSLLHVSTISGIAIAVLTAAYFLAQLARAVAL